MTVKCFTTAHISIIIWTELPKYSMQIR